MATATSYSSVPTTTYDIHPNDFLNQNYQATIDGTFGIVGPGGSFYPPSLNKVQTPVSSTYPLPFQYPNNLSCIKPPQLGLTPTFPTNQVRGLPPSHFQPYNAVPHFQTQPSFTTVLSPPTSGSSSSLQGALTPSPASLGKKLQKANLKLKEKGKRATRHATQSTKGELLSGIRKRKRGPNKRPPGTSFSELLDGLTHKVREALEEEYKGCCDSINVKDISTKQKHWFTNRHCLNLPKEYQEDIPNFTCPAFLAFNSKCRAKAGRYDSTERHCQNCAGFQEIISDKKEAFPVLITRSEYRDFQIARMALADSESENKGKDEATKLAVGSVRMLAELFKDGLPVTNHHEGESNGSGATAVDHTTQSTASIHPPTTSEPVLESVDWGLDDVAFSDFLRDDYLV